MCCITHHAVNSAFTSIDDSAAVVEDYSALVQSRNRVEEVESAQIPLKVSVKDHDTLNCIETRTINNHSQDNPNGINILCSAVKRFPIAVTVIIFTVKVHC